MRCDDQRIGSRRSGRRRSANRCRPVAVIHNVMPDGSEPDSEREGIGVPVAFTWKLQLLPTKQVVVLAEIRCGAEFPEKNVAIPVAHTCAVAAAKDELYVPIGCRNWLSVSSARCVVDRAVQPDPAVIAISELVPAYPISSSLATTVVTVGLVALVDDATLPSACWSMELTPEYSWHTGSMYVPPPEFHAMLMASAPPTVPSA